jgi:hypothetical protein
VVDTVAVDAANVGENVVVDEFAELLVGDAEELEKEREDQKGLTEAAVADGNEGLDDGETELRVEDGRVLLKESNQIVGKLVTNLLAVRATDRREKLDEVGVVVVRLVRVERENLLKLLVAVQLLLKVIAIGLPITLTFVLQLLERRGVRHG